MLSSRNEQIAACQYKGALNDSQVTIPPEKRIWPD